MTPHISPYLQTPLKKPPLECINCGGRLALGEHRRRGQITRSCEVCALVWLPGYDGKLRMFSREAIVAGASAHAVLDQLEIHGCIRRGDLVQRISKLLRIHTSDVHVSHLNTSGRLEVARWGVVELERITKERAEKYAAQRERAMRAAEGVRP
jgi:hypothetical protein